MKRLTISDVTNGWTVRISRKDGSTFIAHENNPGQRAFFTKHAEARTFVKEIWTLKMRGRIVPAQLILKTGA